MDEVKTAIAEGRPYSVVFDKLNAHHPMFVIVKANHKVSLYRIYCEDIHGIYLYGMWHATTAISTNICYEYNMSDVMKMEKYQEVLALPKFINTSCVYTFVSENWTYRQNQGLFLLPQIPLTYSSWAQQYIYI